MTETKYETLKQLGGKAEIPASPDYETLGGFMLTKLQGIPRGGEVVQHARHKFTIVDMDGMRISKVKIDLAPQKVA